jgi:hypothetical protein
MLTRLLLENLNKREHLRYMCLHVRNIIKIVVGDPLFSICISAEYYFSVMLSYVNRTLHCKVFVMLYSIRLSSLELCPTCNRYINTK